MGHARSQRHAGRVAEAMGRIYAAGLTTTSGGNISVRDAEGRVWITPKAVDKGRLSESDIVCVTPGGEASGRHAPSSEYPFHRAIYDRCPGLDAIVHAHPAALVACSVVQGPPPMNVIPRASQVCAGVGFAPYAMTGSEALGENIAAEFSRGRRAVIMENHGTVVGGSDLDDALARFEVFEAVAQSIVHACAIGRPRHLSDADIRQYEAAIAGDLDEAERLPAREEEPGLRQTLAELVRRACSQGMLVSSFGSFSARLGEDDFLVTPRDMNCRRAVPQDLVRVHDGCREPAGHPSRAAAVHRAIYRANPAVRSILSSRPPHLMGFAIAGLKPDVRTIPESWLFLQDMPLAPFGAPAADPEGFARMFGPSSPAVLVANDAVYVTGGEPLETFDRLEVAEFTARSLVMSRSLGELSPISDRQVEDLKKKFF